MDTDRGRAVYAIALAAQQVGLSARTLRIYEFEGLIRPARASGDQRLYSEQDLIWIRCISELIHGHSLTTVGIRRLLDLIPCWEVKHCPDDVAAGCAPFLNIPDMAARAPQRLIAAARPPQPQEAEASEGAVEVKIFYGIKEFGAIFPCMKCIQAERIARRIAERHPGRVVVRKYDAISEEADRHGVMMTPTVIVNGEVVASGKGLSANRLEQLLEQHLKDRGEEAKSRGGEESKRRRE
jgi:DNA-binding transcriptional MerR regulator